jgi:hypothetical protein
LNRELFPDPPAFLEWVHDKGLRATLNLHPAQGVQHFEEVYPRFAEAMGVDRAGEQAIPFRITDKQFVEHYFRLLHHPMEEQGVDFWWGDWQQGGSSEMKGLDLFQIIWAWNDYLGPLIYINKEDLYPFALAINRLRTSLSGAFQAPLAYPYLMAVSTVATVPILIFFFFVQRTFIEGISLTGIKG